MALTVPLPARVVALLRHNTHPGLQLDKYVASWDGQAPPGKLSERVQRPAVEAVANLARQAPADLDLPGLLARRRRVLTGLQARLRTFRTAGPLTLHLARASALENAGICLHPLYGFVYLPGSGLKGMAHAYACEVWLPAQADQGQAWETICQVFGWAPSPWLRDLARRHGARVPPESRAGSVVFHDAWPQAWPVLTVDILNNHHTEYYQKGQPPGDWDSPVPVYFLSVPAGHTFGFALSKRRDDVADELLCRADEWLAGALVHAGAGAKTATGYGAFQPEADAEELGPALATTWTQIQQARQRAECRVTLELVTPAFLAGARQQAEDCELRPASLRGLLRWWWRTLHAGYVDVATLARLEAALWGDTVIGSAIQITLLPASPPQVRRFAFKDRFDPQAGFKREHNLADRPNRKTTQGLFYVSYGMDDSRGERQRHFIEPGASWEIALRARRAHFQSQASRITGQGTVAAENVLEQATAALWLLATYGAAGSKSRKGFGSLEATHSSLDGHNLERCRQAAADLRQRLGLPNAFVADRAESPNCEQAQFLDDIITPWSDPWKVLDEVGFAYQSFAQLMAHKPAKAALGLPRKIHGPRDDGPLQGQRDWQPPVFLDFPRRQRSTNPRDARHASPVHVHVARSADGLLAVRAVGFAARYLPALETSERLLQEFLAHFGAKLRERMQGHAPAVRPRSLPQTPTHALPGTHKREHGTPATVKILAARSGGFDVEETGRPHGVLNQGKAPDPLPEIGTTIEVYVHNDDPRKPQYRWDRPAPPSAPRGRGAGGRGGPPPRRR